MKRRRLEVKRKTRFSLKKRDFSANRSAASARKRSKRAEKNRVRRLTFPEIAIILKTLAARSLP
jgi:hypothetical protein